MFHGLRSCVSFGYVVDSQNETDFPIRDFNVPIIYVLLCCPNNHETFMGLYKFFVLTSNNHSWNPFETYSQKGLCHL